MASIVSSGDRDPIRWVAEHATPLVGSVVAAGGGMIAASAAGDPLPAVLVWVSIPLALGRRRIQRLMG